MLLLLIFLTFSSCSISKNVYNNHKIPFCPQYDEEGKAKNQTLHKEKFHVFIYDWMRVENCSLCADAFSIKVFLYTSKLFGVFCFHMQESFYGEMFWIRIIICVESSEWQDEKNF